MRETHLSPDTLYVADAMAWDEAVLLVEIIRDACQESRPVWPAHTLGTTTGEAYVIAMAQN